MGTMKHLIEQLTEATITFKPGHDSDLKMMGLSPKTSLVFWAKPRKGVLVFLGGPEEDGHTWSMKIFDEEDERNSPLDDPSDFAKFGGKTSTEVFVQAKAYLQKWLRENPPGWYRKGIDARFKELGKPDYDAPGRYW